MKKSIFIFALLFFSITSYTQEVIEIVEDADADAEFEFDEDTGNTSYDSKYRITRINETFSYIYSKKTYKYGLLKDGKKFFPVIFSKSYSSKDDDYSIVLGINSRYGLFNLKTEKWDIPMMYSSLEYLGNKIYLAKNEKYYGIVDNKNAVILDFEWKSFSKISSYYASYSSMENYYKVSRYEYSDQQYGVINIITKKLVIPCEYSSLKKVKNSNYFIVKKDDKYNLADINNNVLFKNWYEQIVPPKGGRNLFIVKLNDKMGVVDENEKPIVPIEYKYIKTYPYKDGSYLAENKDGFFGCIMIDGRVTLPFIYTNIDKNTTNNILSTKGSKCGVIKVNDGAPYELATCDYDSIITSGKIFIIEKNHKFGLMNGYGKVVSSVDYDTIISYKSGYYNFYPLIAVKKGKYFLMDNAGVQLNTTSFSNIRQLFLQKKYNNVDKSYLIAEDAKGKAGLIDLYGKEIIPFMFDDIVLRFENFVLVKKKDKYGLYDLYKNKSLIPTEFDQILFTEKESIIGMKENKFYLINRKGEIVEEI